MDFMAGKNAFSTLSDEYRVLPEVLMMNEPDPRGRSNWWFQNEFRCFLKSDIFDFFIYRFSFSFTLDSFFRKNSEKDLFLSISSKKRSDISTSSWLIEQFFGGRSVIRQVRYHGTIVLLLHSFVPFHNHLDISKIYFAVFYKIKIL